MTKIYRKTFTLIRGQRITVDLIALVAVRECKSGSTELYFNGGTIEIREPYDIVKDAWDHALYQKGLV